MQVFHLFLAISAVAAESTPGTETILLVRGGYGPGVNLFSSGSHTHRHSSKAPVDRTPVEKDELAKLNNASQTAQVLNSQLQTAIRTTYAALQESEQVRVDDANLKERVTVDERKIQQGAGAEKAQSQLEAEVKSLQAQLLAEKSRTLQEHMRGEALRAKTASLENDIKVISKSWKAAAEHQANLAKQAVADATAGKKAPVATTKAPAAKKVAPKAPVALKAKNQKKAAKKATKKVVKKAVVEEKAADEDSDNDDDSDNDADDDADAPDSADDDANDN